MKNKECLLIDVIEILPEGVDCYIQAPSLDDNVVLGLMIDTNFDYYKCIKLKGVLKEKFINRINNYPIEEYFQSIEIKFNNKLLFEGYDGVEFGILSNSINIPKWFTEKYIMTEICNVSNEW